MTKGTVAFVTTMTVLIAYGLFASLYWPVTAISFDVWGLGYSRIPSENRAATVVGTIFWATIAVVLTITTVTRNRPSAFVSIGIVALTLVGPTTLAGVGVYNTVPTSTPYPDQVTPFVLGAGLLSLAGALILSVRKGTEAKQAEVGHSIDP